MVYEFTVVDEEAISNGVFDIPTPHGLDMLRLPALGLLVIQSKLLIQKLKCRGHCQTSISAFILTQGLVKSRATPSPVV